MPTVPQGHKLAEDVIPELDENMITITSMKVEPKPTMKEIFGRTDSDTEILSRPNLLSTSPNIDIPGTSKRPFAFPSSAPPTLVFHPPPNEAPREEAQIGPDGDHPDDNFQGTAFDGEMKKLVKSFELQQREGLDREEDDDHDGSKNPLLVDTNEPT